MKSLSKIFGIILVGVIVLHYSSQTIIAKNQGNLLELSSNTGKSLRDELEEIQKKLKEIGERKSDLESNKSAEQGNINSFQKEIVILQNKISSLSIQIEEKELQIQELELQIAILIEEIDRLEKSILDAQDQISELEKDTNSRLLSMYLTQKQNMNLSTTMFSSFSPSDFVKTDSYRYAFQKDTNDKLTILETTRDQLEEDQVQVEKDKTDLDRNRETIENEKIALDIQRGEMQTQKSVFDNKKAESLNRINGYDQLISVLSTEEKELLARQDAIQSALLSRGEVANGLPIRAGTFLGIEGSTGYATGKHLHFGVSIDGVIQNPCAYLPARAYGDCGGNGRLIKPLTNAVLTSGFRTSYRPSHAAIDIATGLNSSGGQVQASHDGYAYFFFEPCPKWAPICNNGGAIVAKVCENNGCKGGLSTVYYHLRCTAEPSSSSRSCY